MKYVEREFECWRGWFRPGRRGALWAGAALFAFAVACNRVDTTTLDIEDRSEVLPSLPEPVVSEPRPSRGEPGAIGQEPDVDEPAPDVAPGLDALPRAAPFLRMPANGSVTSNGWQAVPVAPELTFDSPVLLVEAPGTGQLFVLEREGRIFSFDAQAPSPEKHLVLDLSDVTQGLSDCGLLGLAFHPDFGRDGSPNRGSIFVQYQHSESPVRTPVVSDMLTHWRLVKLTVDLPTLTVDKSTMVVLIDQLDQNPLHSGGSMFFHPRDGFLYVTVGDEGGARCRFQNCQRIDGDLFSGVLRLDVDMLGGSTSHPAPRQPATGSTANYFIPSDNPFVGKPGVLEEFYALGLRSPHRMSYDPVDDVAWIGDVGQGQRDELDVLSPGANYEWNVFEAFRPGPGVEPIERIGVWTDPVLELPRAEARAVIGGGVYRGQRFPELWGKYIFGDFYFGNVWALSYEKTERNVEVVDRVPLIEGFLGRISTITSLGFDSDGNVYILSLGEGSTLYRLERTTPSTNLPSLLSATGAFQNTPALSPARGLLPYGVQSALWSDGATKRRFMSLPEGTEIAFADQGPWVFPEGTVFVKHFEMAMDERRPEEVRRLETRVLVAAEGGGYYGVSYRWNGDEADADAVLQSQVEELDVIQSDGSTRHQKYFYPGPNDCLVCHNADAGYVLGVRTDQLNGAFRYAATGRRSNQLLTWSELGLLDTSLGEDPGGDYGSLASLDDESRSVEDRVRSYWDSNCSMCHGVVDGLRATWDARYETPLEDQGVLDVAPFGGAEVEGEALIRPRDVDSSVMFQRDASVDVVDRMPPIGRNRADERYIALLERWIASL